MTLCLRGERICLCLRLNWKLETRNWKLIFENVAQDIVRRAMAGGATAAECVVREGDEFSTLVRLGQVETLKESGSRSIGVRVFYGKRSASTYSSDFSREGLDRMLKSALELAKITSEDPFGGIPEAIATRLAPGRSRSLLTPTSTRCLAKSASTTLAAPKRPRSTSTRASRILKAARSMLPPVTKCWPTPTDLSASIAARIARSLPCRSRKTENGAMQRDYWFSVARNLGRLDLAEEVGKIAAQRTLRRLGARKVKTAKVPVIFDPHGGHFDPGTHF